MAQPSTTLTMFVLGQTQHSWPQSTHTPTHSTGHPTQLTYNLSPLPSQVPHLGWGETWWDTTQMNFSTKYSRNRHQLRSITLVITNLNHSLP